MGHEDINRITKELEDLLMMNGKTAPAEDREQKLQQNGSQEGIEVLEEIRDDRKALKETLGDFQEDIEAWENASEDFREGMRTTEEDSEIFQEETDWEDWEEDGVYSGSRRWSLVRPRDGLVVAFLAPVIIMLIIFAQRGIFPFGEESFLRTDMYHQYAPFFSEFRHKLAEGESLLYSWNVGMGVNFSALYAYYLASPLNWLLVLCPETLVIEFMTYMIVLKTGLSGLSMAYYLRRHCKTRNFGIAFFAIFYALSGYMAAYSWNIMWLDCIILFPLIMLGLEALVKEGKGLLYCLALGASILSNYYISIMTCIFMVLYFAALMAMERRRIEKKYIGRCGLFVLYSLLAGGLAALVLLPEIYALMLTASGQFNFPKLQDPYFSIFDMAARHMGNVETEIGLDHWPNIYCGVAVLVLLPLYLAAKRISGKEKAVYSVLLLFFFASFSVNVLNFIWHGFHFPNSLPCRQSYIYIFLVLVMCCKAYLHLQEMPWRHVLIAFWGAVGFVVLAQKLVKQDHFHFTVFYAAILFLAFYLWVIWLYRKGQRFENRAMLLALLLVSVESAVNMTVTSVTTTSRTAYISDNKAVRRLVDSVLPANRFFRMEKVTRKTKNDGAWMNFPSVSLFSSTANADLTKVFKKLGCESSTNAYSITGSTPLVDMLFAVEYGLYSEDPEDTGIREFMAREDETTLYRNRYTLPLGFLVSDDFQRQWDLELGNPADVQNSLADCVGAENVLNMVMDVSGTGKELTFYPETGGEYYAYVGDTRVEKVTVSGWKGTKTYNNVNRGYLLELGYCVAGEPVTLTTDDNTDSIWADVYQFSETGLVQIYEKLSQTPWELTSWQETYLEGKVAAKHPGVLFTTIPYDKGWTILVDGEEQRPTKMLDAFLGVPLTGGEHVITMSYQPEGMMEGRLISAGALIILIGIEAGRRFWRKQEWEEYGEEDQAAVGADADDEDCQMDAGNEEDEKTCQIGAGNDYLPAADKPENDRAGIETAVEEGIHKDETKGFEA
ncbi:hypothetical protein D7X87_07165 [bacterium D16-54]|nr:hypothetical protein D7X87_07165 [bacterium D16-54]RKJ15496.1 hypothetical protein D7X65_07160 [bacterium D16-56]